MTGLAKNTAAMNRAGAACGCGALIYLAARSLLTRLASLLLALRVPGASLQNPAGASQLEAALLRIGVSGLALAAPFLLLAHCMQKPKAYWSSHVRELLLLYQPSGIYAGITVFPVAVSAIPASWKRNHRLWRPPPATDTASLGEENRSKKA